MRDYTIVEDGISVYNLRVLSWVAELECEARDFTPRMKWHEDSKLIYHLRRWYNAFLPHITPYQMSIYKWWLKTGKYTDHLILEKLLHFFFQSLLSSIKPIYYHVALCYNLEIDVFMQKSIIYNGSFFLV